MKLELNLRKIEMDMDRRVNIEKLNISLSIIGTCPMPNECKDKNKAQENGRKLGGLSDDFKGPGPHLRSVLRVMVPIYFSWLAWPWLGSEAG